MNPDDFRRSPAGQLVPTIRGAWAFVPNPLPPAVDLSGLSGILTNAALRVGELRGIGTTLPNPYLLIRPFQRREAVASSAIEGTVTSLAQLLLFETEETGSTRGTDAREVSNYVRALEYGIQALDRLPVSLRLISELHAVLLRGLPGHRGGRVNPGEFRREQNWIGRPDNDIANARFVPPPPNEMTAAMDALEKYIHVPLERDPHILVRLALIHYQFEAIHPFPDGNGRIGRLLIPLIIAAVGLMPQPLLYLSPYFERRQDSYYDHLLDVSRTGAWESWVRFFLHGIIEQCEDTISRVTDLQRLHSEYRERLRSGRAAGLPLQLVDLIFESPYISVSRGQRQLGSSYAGVRRALDRLVTEGMLRVIIDRRPRIYLAPDIFEIISRPFGTDGTPPIPPAP